MATAFMLVMIILTLALAVYVQWKLPLFTSSYGRAWGLRLLLLVVGAGLAALSVYMSDTFGTVTILAALLAFGLAHLPAAVVLILKRIRASS